MPEHPNFQEKGEAEINKMMSIARADTSPTINQEEITAQMIVTTIKGFIVQFSSNDA